MNDNKQGAQVRFGTTRWSVVLRAGAAASDETRDALNELIESYWYPLYAFSRRCGNSHHDALDLTQGFLAHLLQGEALRSVSPDKGRFRSFLLASFKNFMANQRRAAATLRRGGSVNTISLNDADFRIRYDREPAVNETPELLFERSWVAELLARVRARLADEYQRAGKQELFEFLEPHLASCREATPRAEICTRLNLSAAALAMSIHRMRRRYGELVREEVAATVDDPAHVDDELRTLMSLVSPTS
jgi:RNA polymerase sigma-70 factor (ECF subfamily)